MSQLHDSADKITRRGQAIYERQIQSTLSPEDQGKFLVLDIETGDYHIDASEIVALKRAREARPTGTFYILRIGSPVAYRLGRCGPHARP